MPTYEKMWSAVKHVTLDVFKASELKWTEIKAARVLQQQKYNFFVKLVQFIEFHLRCFERTLSFV